MTADLRHPGLRDTYVAEVAHGVQTVVLMIGQHCSWVGSPGQARRLGEALIRQAGYSEQIPDEQ